MRGTITKRGKHSWRLKFDVDRDPSCERRIRYQIVKGTRSELLALQWCNVDLDRATIKVEFSLEETKAGLGFKGPKSKHGRRSISLPPSSVAMLNKHRLEQLEF